MNLFVRIHRTRRNLHWWKSTFLGIFKYLFGSKQALALSLRMRGLGSFATAIMGPLSSSGPPPAFPSFFASSLCFPRLVRESTCSANLFANSPELIFRWFGTAAKCFFWGCSSSKREWCITREVFKCETETICSKHSGMPFGGGETLRPGKAQTTHVRTTPRKEKYFSSFG